jgi:hypothetical protein
MYLLLTLEYILFLSASYSTEFTSDNEASQVWLVILIEAFTVCCTTGVMLSDVVGTGVVVEVVGTCVVVEVVGACVVVEVVGACVVVEVVGACVVVEVVGACVVVVVVGA